MGRLCWHCCEPAQEASSSSLHHRGMLRAVLGQPVWCEAEAQKPEAEPPITPSLPEMPVAIKEGIESARATVGEVVETAETARAEVEGHVEAADEAVERGFKG